MLNIKVQSGHWEMHWKCPGLLRTPRHKKILIKKWSHLPPQLWGHTQGDFIHMKCSHFLHSDPSLSLPSHPEQKSEQQISEGPCWEGSSSLLHCRRSFSASQGMQENLTEEYLHFSPDLKHHSQAPAELMLQQEKVKEIIIMHQLAENRNKPRKAQYTCNH